MDMTSQMSELVYGVFVSSSVLCLWMVLCGVLRGIFNIKLRKGFAGAGKRSDNCGLLGTRPDAPVFYAVLSFNI